MTTNQQINTVLAYLYDLQITKCTDYSKMPDYKELFKLILPNLNKNESHSLIETLKEKDLIRLVTEMKSLDLLIYHVVLTTKSVSIMRDFGTYLKYIESLKEQNSKLSITNNIQDSKINNSQFVQGLESFESLAISQAINSSPAKKEPAQSTIIKLIDIAKKYWWGVLIPIGLIIVNLLIEYKSGYFVKPN